MNSGGTKKLVLLLNKIGKLFFVLLAVLGRLLLNASTFQSYLSLSIYIKKQIHFLSLATFTFTQIASSSLSLLLLPINYYSLLTITSPYKGICYF